MAHERRWAWAGLVVVLALSGVVRDRLLEIPLDRDEGDYAYHAQLLLDGVPPYSQAYEMRPPGIFATYAVFLTLFGQTREAIHLGLWITNAATTLCVFLLARRLFGGMAGLAGAASFASLSLSRTVEGVSANTEQFLLLPVVAGLLQLLRALESRNASSVFLSGLLFGLAITLKQHAAFFAAFALLFLVWRERSNMERSDFVRRALAFSIGAAAPYVAVIVLIGGFGDFEKFWFWTVLYAQSYIEAPPLTVGLARLGERLADSLQSFWALWCIASIGAGALLRERRNWACPFVFGLALFSFLAVCLGLTFRTHYFLLLFPGLALFVGAAVKMLGDLVAVKWSPAVARTAQIAAVTAAIIQFGWAERDYLFKLDPVTASRRIYGVNPFPESLEIARFVAKRTESRDTIAVIGSEPQIYFYAKRRSASAHILTYPLMGAGDTGMRLQQEMIRQVEAAQPKILINIAIENSWLRTPESPDLIFRWVEQYSAMHYVRVGLVDFAGTKRATYYWGRRHRMVRPLSPRSISIFERQR